VTAGGLYGRVTALDDDIVSVEVAPGTTVRVARHAVAGVVPPERPQTDGGDSG
jgi:preprotein translocase subunit YajC